MRRGGSFENITEYNIRKYEVSGTTVKKMLYAGDEKERYFHIYYSDQKASAGHEQIEAKIDRMTKYLDKVKGKKVIIGEGFKQYFHLEMDRTFLYAREKADAVQQEINLCGYFVIITSKKMTAGEALELFMSRDASEKLFRGTSPILGIRACGCSQTRRQERRY